MNSKINLKKPSYYRLKYNLKCWLFLPITFFRRVVFGKDKLAKRFFLDKWGFLPKDLVQSAAERNTIWISANSGGEVTQAVSFFKKIKKKVPEYNLIISTESYDTFQFAQALEGVDFVFFPPWDMGFICKRVLKKLRPSVLIFIEHCYFPILSQKAKKFKIKTLMCSGMINFQLLKGYFLMQRAYALRYYKYIDKFAVKTKEDSENLSKLDVEQNQIHILGDLKFDLERILLDEEEKEKYRKELNLSSTDRVFIVGSIHEGEVDLVFEAFHTVRKNYPGLKLLLAPRWEIDAQLIEARSKEYNYSLTRRSQLNPEKPDRYDVLIIDTFGELARLYGVASVIFIASTIIPSNIRRLGHNVFEALAHGVPVLFGPHRGLWREITEQLKEAWPGCEVNDSGSLANSINETLNDDDLTLKLKDVALRLTRTDIDIVDKYLAFVREFI